MKTEVPVTTGFQAEYGRLKDDMLFRLKSANEFELGAITAMGVILTLGNVFGNGQFFYIGNIAAGAVLYGCAQCVVPNIYTVYSAFAYIRAQVQLGHYPASFLWDEFYSSVEHESGAMPPDVIRRNHHSVLFTCLGVTNLIVLVIGAVATSQYVPAVVALAPSLAVVIPIWRIHQIYVRKPELDKAWMGKLSQE